MNKIEDDNFIKLVIDTQNDVEGAFEELYKETISFSYSIVSLLLKNEEDIEDALQNSYIQVSRDIKDLKNPESFKSWLSITVKRECQKHIAKHKQMTDVFSTATKTKEFESPAEEVLPFDLIERKEISEAVRNIVNSLPDDKRACIVLYYFEQNSLSEIAEILGIPEGTVKSRLYHARKILEKKFKKLQSKDESLLGISAIPLIVTFFAYQTKNIVVPAAIESAALGAVAVNSAATIGATSATAAGSTAAGASVTASVRTGAATAVTTKIAAIAVAATVATGGTVATVNVVKEHRANEATTAIVYETITEEYATAAMLFVEETTTAPEEPSAKILPTAQEMVGTAVSGTEKSITNTAEEFTTSVKRNDPTATRRDYSTTRQAKTTVHTTEHKTTALHTTARVTTTEPGKTPEKMTTSLAEVYDVSSGVLGEYSGKESNVSVPSSVGSETVTAIGTGAFAGNTDIRSVHIPSGVTRIGQEAFVDCSNLTSVSLRSIGIGAFCSCASLTSVNIPSGVTTVGDDAFADCSSLETVTIPSSVTSIGYNAFGGCDNLTIKCSSGSAAHDYVVENSIDYELI